jgi:beta-glucanase (GH16 family)
MLNGSTTDGRPVIWLLEIRDEDDVNPKLLAFNGSNYYYEIDIEMWKEKFGYTIHVNHNGKQYDKLSGYCQCGSYYRDKSLLRDLRRGFHLHTIDWQYDYVRFYIDGLLTAKFKNEMHLPMQIIMSKLEIGKVLVTK